MLRNAMHL